MAKAVVNEFINKVEVNTFIENGVRFSVTVRVCPNRFTNSCLSDSNTPVRITRGQKTDFISKPITVTRHTVYRCTLPTYITFYIHELAHRAL